jgi:pilus assembly protein CpaE
MTVQRVAIVDPSDATRNSLREMLLGIDFIWLEAESPRYEFFPDVVQQASPDLVIIGLDSDRNKSLALVNELAITYPGLPILTFSTDHKTLLESLTLGARYFLTHPIALEDMLSALRRVQMDAGKHALPTKSDSASPTSRQPQSSQIYTILGTRGGVGCTSVAVNLACALAADPSNSVALLDLDLALGDVDVALEVTPENTIADLMMNFERLDMNFIKRSMVKHQSGVSILCHPIQIADIYSVQAQQLERIITLLRISYSHLILDIGKSLQEIDRLAIQIADVILLLSELELSSLRNAVRLRLELGNDEELLQRFRIVMNKVGANTSEDGISLKKAEETLGAPIYWEIPYDPKAFAAARSLGQPLSQCAPKSKALQSFMGLAQNLTGKKPATPQQSSGSWWRFGKK